MFARRHGRRHQHDDDHGRGHLRAEEPVAPWRLLVVQRKGEGVKKMKRPEEPDEIAHARPIHDLGALSSRSFHVGGVRRHAVVHRLAQALPGLEVRHQLFGNDDLLAAARLRPTRGGRRLIEKLPKPRISMRCPRASASDIASRMVLTAANSAVALRDCASWAKRSASRATRSERAARQRPRRCCAVPSACPAWRAAGRPGWWCRRSRARWSAPGAASPPAGRLVLGLDRQLDRARSCGRR